MEVLYSTVLLLALDLNINFNNLAQRNKQAWLHSEIFVLDLGVTS